MPPCRNIAMVFLRSALFNVCFYALTNILVLLGIPALFGDREDVERQARRWASLSLVLLERICRVKVEFRGLEHLPEGAAVIASKHQSTLDTLALILKVRDFTFVYKRELGMIPLFGGYLRQSDQIQIDRAKRGAALMEVIAHAKRIFAANRRLIIFPEGTRRAAGAPPRYKAGVARIVKDTGVICVPVALNSGLFWPRRRFIRRAGQVIVEFLEPMPTGLDKESFMRLLETRIETASTRLVAEAVARNPSLGTALAKIPASST